MDKKKFMKVVRQAFKNIVETAEKEWIVLVMSASCRNAVDTNTGPDDVLTVSVNTTQAYWVDFVVHEKTTQDFINKKIFGDD